VRLTGAILGALYSDLRDTALVVRALCHFRSRFLDAVRPMIESKHRIRIRFGFSLVLRSVSPGHNRKT
jgi:hypothetical protein